MLLIKVLLPINFPTIYQNLLAFNSKTVTMQNQLPQYLHSYLAYYSRDLKMKPKMNLNHFIHIKSSYIWLLSTIILPSTIKVRNSSKQILENTWLIHMFIFNDLIKSLFSKHFSLDVWIVQKLQHCGAIFHHMIQIEFGSQVFPHFLLRAMTNNHADISQRW